MYPDDFLIEGRRLVDSSPRVCREVPETHTKDTTMNIFFQIVSMMPTIIQLVKAAEEGPPGFRRRQGQTRLRPWRSRGHDGRCRRVDSRDHESYRPHRRTLQQDRSVSGEGINMTIPKFIQTAFIKGVLVQDRQGSRYASRTILGFIAAAVLAAKDLEWVEGSSW